jgi:hypothetical protein
MRVEKEIRWPDIPRSAADVGAPSGVTRFINQVLDILRRMRNAMSIRDQRMAQAVNALDIETVSTAPTAAPESDGAALRVYDDGAGTRRLYVWVTDAWRYVALT